MAGSDGQSVPVVGGGPMAVKGGPMVLCARSDLSPNRFFSGRLANLAIYNTSVSAPAMATLYDQARSQPHRVTGNATGVQHCMLHACCIQTLFQRHLRLTMLISLACDPRNWRIS